MTVLVEANGLTKRFGERTVVDAISLTVRQGQVLGFLGPNGAGKTTTMRLVTGFLAADAGYAKLDGFDVSEAPVEARRLLGYLPEGAPLYAEMTPWQMLRFVAEARGMEKKHFQNRAEQVIAQLQLAEVLTQPIETLSKGFRRRVGLAASILHDPKILILDEPTDGLDPLQKLEVRSLIQAIAKEKAIIISTHILEEVEALCTDVALIARGKLLAHTTPAALEAQDPYSGHLLLQLATEELDEAVQQLRALDGIETAEALDGRVRLELAAGNLQVQQAIVELCHRRQYGLLRMSPPPGALERVFRKLTHFQE